jgi:hypothetical protein
MNTIASLIAFLVFLVCLATALGLVAGGHLLWWILTFLALAVLLGWAGFGRFFGGPRA